MARGFVYPLLNCLKVTTILFRKFLECFAVNEYTVLFHARNYRNERLFDFPIYLGQPSGLLYRFLEVSIRFVECLFAGIAEHIFECWVSEIRADEPEHDLCLLDSFGRNLFLGPSSLLFFIIQLATNERLCSST